MYNIHQSFIHYGNLYSKATTQKR